MGVNTEFVTANFDGPIAYLHLNRPNRRNALSLEMMQSLMAALENAAARTATRVIVLAGAGPAFSAGHDLAEMRDTRDPTFYAELFTTCTNLMESLHALRVPIIAKVHGVATAAGCQLVASCDLAVCTETARFATPGVNIGLFCSTPMVPISRAVGRKRAMEMLLTGTMIDAATAVDWGLVNRAVPADDLDAVVDELAATIAAASAEVITLGKRAFWQQIEADEHDAYGHAAQVMQENAMLDDAQEGMTAFLEKRAPRWTGS